MIPAVSVILALVESSVFPALKHFRENNEITLAIEPKIMPTIIMALTAWN